VYPKSSLSPGAHGTLKLMFGKRTQLLRSGARAPEFQLARLGGGAVKLADAIANGPAVLAFFKISCPVCQLTLPFLDRIAAAGTIAVYGISQNSERDTRRFVEEYSLAFPMLLDSEDAGYPASNAYGIAHVPTIFLVERDGALGRVVEGWSEGDVAWLGTRAGVNPLRPTDNVPELKAG